MKLQPKLLVLPFRAADLLWVPNVERFVDLKDKVHRAATNKKRRGGIRFAGIKYGDKNNICVG